MPGSLGELAYVALRGRDPAGEATPIEFKDGLTPDQHADKALAKLKGIIARFANEADAVSLRWSARCGRRATATTTISRA